MTHAPALFILTEQLTAWGHKLAADTSSHRAATLMWSNATTPRFDKGQHFFPLGGTGHGRDAPPAPVQALPKPRPSFPQGTVPRHVHAKNSRYFLGGEDVYLALRPAPNGSENGGPARGPLTRRGPCPRGQTCSEAAAAIFLRSRCGCPGLPLPEGGKEGGREGGRRRARLRDPAWLRQGRCLGSSLPPRHGPGRGPEPGCWVPPLRGEALGEQIVVTGIKRKAKGDSVHLAQITLYYYYCCFPRWEMPF